MERQDLPADSAQNAWDRPDLRALERRLREVEASVRALREQFDSTLAARQTLPADGEENPTGLTLRRQGEGSVPRPSPGNAIVHGGNTPPHQPVPEDGFGERMKEDARRFARVLVSEIELYYQAEVAQGRVHKDLYARLKSPIQRSRRAYENRYGKMASGGESDYFHEELVRSLAQNDVSLLGPDADIFT